MEGHAACKKPASIIQEDYTTRAVLSYSQVRAAILERVLLLESGAEFAATPRKIHSLHNPRNQTAAKNINQQDKRQKDKLPSVSCSGTVGRYSIRKNLSDEVHYLIRYLSRARCTLFAYGPADATAIPKPHHSNPDWFYLSGTRLPGLSQKRGR